MMGIPIPTTAFSLGEILALTKSALRTLNVVDAEVDTPCRSTANACAVKVWPKGNVCGDDVHTSAAGERAPEICVPSLALITTDVSVPPAATTLSSASGATLACGSPGANNTVALDLLDPASGVTNDKSEPESVLVPVPPLDAELLVDAPEQAVNVALKDNTTQATIKVGEVRFITPPLCAQKGEYASLTVLKRPKQA
jgi:hypothetical protein